MVAEALRYRPVAVHFSLQAGTGRLHKTDWSHIERLLKLTNTPYVNLHLGSDTGCGLLLDISHARITARHQGLDETAYLASLPLATCPYFKM